MVRTLIRRVTHKKEPQQRRGGGQEEVRGTIFLFLSNKENATDCATGSLLQGNPQVHFFIAPETIPSEPASFCHAFWPEKVAVRVRILSRGASEERCRPQGKHTALGRPHEGQSEILFFGGAMQK